MKRVTSFFIVLLVFSFSLPGLSQNNPGKFLKLSRFDTEINAEKFLSVVDFDNDGIDDITFLDIDTLIIISKDTLRYYPAFNPLFTQTAYGLHLAYYTDINNQTTF